jgi:hypothetical protein
MIASCVARAVDTATGNPIAP